MHKSAGRRRGSKCAARRPRLCGSGIICIISGLRGTATQIPRSITRDVLESDRLTHGLPRASAGIYINNYYNKYCIRTTRIHTGVVSNFSKGCKI